MRVCVRVLRVSLCFAFVRVCCMYSVFPLLPSRLCVCVCAYVGVLVHARTHTHMHMHCMHAPT